MLTDQRGEIDLESEQGVFAGDSRFVKVGDSVLHLRFWREGSDSRWEVLKQHGSIEVRDAPEQGVAIRGAVGPRTADFNGGAQ